MRRLAGRLGFLHRTLWQRDQAYRWAVLLGPPPLFGCTLAALALAAWYQVVPPAPGGGSGPGIPWAHWDRPVPQADGPITVAPVAPLPQGDASGRFVGVQFGWAGDIKPMTVDATMDATVLNASFVPLTLDGPTIPLARILDAGPPSGLFVGVVSTMFPARTAGVYEFAARLSWTGAQTANCIVRLATAHRSLLRNINLNLTSQSVVTYSPAELRLQPGLVPIVVATGCWRGERMVGPGTLTLLVRRPGEAAATPIAAEEAIRSAPRTAANGG